jgi:hypothetical protein
MLMRITGGSSRILSGWNHGSNKSRILNETGYNRKCVTRK